MAEVAEPLEVRPSARLSPPPANATLPWSSAPAERDNGRFYNTTLLITPEGIALKYRKTHLWPSERGVYEAGDRFATCLWNGVRVGLLICYDIEFPETAAPGATGCRIVDR